MVTAFTGIGSSHVQESAIQLSRFAEVVLAFESCWIRLI
jgi:hypothetical protein